jgi:hypothetical protein
MFLKNLGKFQVASLNETVIPADKVVVEMLSDLQAEMEYLRRTLSRERASGSRKPLPVEVGSSIKSAIIDYWEANPDRKFSDLKGDFKFYADILEKANVAQYFDSVKDFDDVVDALLMLVAVPMTRQKKA